MYVLLCIFPPQKKTAPLSTAKLNTSLGSGYGGCKRQRVNAPRWLSPLDSRSSSSFQLPLSSKVARLPQAASLSLALRASDSSGSSPSLPAAPRGGRTSPRRRLPEPAAGGPRLSIAAGGKPGGLLLGASPKALRKGVRGQDPQNPQPGVRWVWRASAGGERGFTPERRLFAPKSSVRGIPN